MSSMCPYVSSLSYSLFPVLPATVILEWKCMASCFGVRELIPRYVQQNLEMINTVLCMFDFQGNSKLFNLFELREVFLVLWT